jgi:hypothetical protein
LAIGIALSGCALLLAERVRVQGRGFYRFAFASLVAAIGLAIGLLGSLIACLWAFTDHTVAYHNENLCLANPLTLLAGCAALSLLGRSRRAERWNYALWVVLAASTALWLALKLSLAAFDQDVTLSAASFVPINFSLAWAAHRMWTRPSYGEPGA